jgi:DNA-binding response OmpR family regulator
MAKLIVIIEDDEQLRNMLKMSFELEGFQVLGLQDGSEFEFIRPEQVDLVITDLIMPEKDGLKVIRDLKTAQPSLKMVAISGGGRRGPESYLDTARNLGVDIAIAKPFERKELIRQVKILLKD